MKYKLESDDGTYSLTGVKHEVDDSFSASTNADIKSDQWHSVPLAGGLPQSAPRPEKANLTERTVQDLCRQSTSASYCDPAQSGRPCPVCQKMLTSTRGYKLHLDAHKGIFPHTCSYCQRGFLSKTGLEGHLVQHTNKKMYMCASCGKEFKYKHGLHYHHHICPERKK